MSDCLVRAAELLRRVAREQLTAEEAIKEIDAAYAQEGSASARKKLDAAAHHLHHFVADADLRARSQKYKERVASTLLDAARLLEDERG